VLYVVVQKAKSNMETHIDYCAWLNHREEGFYGKKIRETSIAFLDVCGSEGVSVRWRRYS
jgi:hypothetical protein